MIKPEGKNLGNRIGTATNLQVLTFFFCMLFSSTLTARQTIQRKVTSVEGMLGNVIMPKLLCSVDHSAITVNIILSNSCFMELIIPVCYTQRSNYSYLSGKLSDILSP